LIEKLIELDLDRPAIWSTGIMLNATNKNSVKFIYKIYQGSVEMDYSTVTDARLVFTKPRKPSLVETGMMTRDGISYVLSNDLMTLTGVVTGYLMLFTDTGTIATLRYSFVIL